MAIKTKKIRSPRNLNELFWESVQNFPDNEALCFLKGHHYESLSYRELSQEAISLACGLENLGFKSGDAAVIFSENRPEWPICDIAFNMLGVINVPIHSVLSASQLAHILDEIKPKAIFFSNINIETKLLDISEQISKIDYLFSFEDIGENGFNKLNYFKSFIRKQAPSELKSKQIVENGLSISPDQVCSIIYTSGTTGHMKGVKLTHRNFVFDTLALMKWVDVRPTDKFFSILPLSHVLERTVGYYVAIYSGSSVGYSIDLAKVSEELRARKPNIVIAVPRLFEKIYEKVIVKINNNFFVKNLFHYAFRVKKAGRSKVLISFFDKLLFSKIRDNFGGEVRFFVSGGAALSPKIADFFDTIGLPILEGYGLTETAPVISTNRLEDYKFGTVGPVLEGLEVEIREGGEICVKGPNVSPGYVRKTDNKDVFKDGWFYTGDLGNFDRHGFLIITGRKKDLIVLSTGKKVAPGIIEERLSESIFIDQSYVFGEGRKHIGAIIVPNFEALKEIFGSEGTAKLITNPRVNELLANELMRLTNHLASYEKIQKFILIKKPFTIESGELTPKLSLRRHVIYSTYLDYIEKIYQ
ncbi:MAG: long-chain fatty acid--CoA ligase [bacterium]